MCGSCYEAPLLTDAEAARGVVLAPSLERLALRQPLGGVHVVGRWTRCPIRVLPTSDVGGDAVVDSGSRGCSAEKRVSCGVCVALLSVAFGCGAAVPKTVILTLLHSFHRSLSPCWAR